MSDDIEPVWEAYWADRTDQEALELLVRRYAQLAGYLARRALAKAPAYQDSEDILSYAHHGLLNAIERYDPNLAPWRTTPDKSVKFETYATRRVAGSIVDGQRKQDPLARNTRRKVKILKAARDSWWETYGREATLEDLADAVQVDVAEVRQLLLSERSLAVTLDTEQGHDSGVDSDGEVLVRMAEARSQMAIRLAGLPERSRAFILSYYCTYDSEGEPAGLRELCASWEVSSAWGRKLRSQVFDSLLSR